MIGQPMKRFHFPLENILNLKKHDETTVLAEYSAAVTNLSRAKANSVSLKKRLTDEWRAQQEKLRATHNPASLIQQQEGWAYIEEQIKEAEKALAEAENEVTQLESKLKHRRQERKSLESFREKGQIAHQTKVAQIEQYSLDELAGRGVHRRF